MKRLALAIAAVVAIVAMGTWLKRCVDVDRCLDAGGRWLDGTEKCEHD